MEDFDLEVLDNTIKLSSNAIALLQVVPGDSIGIQYSQLNGELLPVLVKEGNILSKSNTISFRGKQRLILTQYGTKFKIVSESGVLYLRGDSEFRAYTNVEQAVKRVLDTKILRDTNYDIQKFDKYEL